MLQKQFTIFETMQKAFNTELKLKLCKNKLHRSNNVRYLCIKIHENLNWKIHKHDFLSKLNRNSFYFVNFEILRSGFFVIFQSHFRV